MIIATNISKSYGEKDILKKISLSIKPGEITVITGPSGGGKTTLLRTLCLLEKPDTGTIHIDGQEIDFQKTGTSKTSQFFPSLTVVFQQLFLWPHLTNRENIMLAIKSSKQNKNVELDSLIEMFEMQAFIDHYPNESSLGQKQRIALARALILSPKYLFLDEITAALDVVQIANITQHLPELTKKGIGIFFITHQIDLAQKIANQIIFMDKGKIIETGDCSLFESPKTLALKSFIDKI